MLVGELKKIIADLPDDMFVSGMTGSGGEGIPVSVYVFDPAEEEEAELEDDEDWQKERRLMVVVDY